ncbi:RNA methyltransferase [Heliobacterium gestii]|uniref:RNA methyltransferase n=1 Tax=Heliomicrobium gestii TaxID=2699 RepID=A0A845LDB9_HELGE|nr:RNA methyltransferase [Heliomicrobium gestii]MBM7866209.1 TrmH family RNA methyltransferase [Heliomicrobium gestii]MZP42465.1 RNA methyltransferase [Heliomicrobium gestii]
MITSPDNQYVKEARSLSRKKERGLTGKYLIEGVRLVEEAVASAVSLAYCLYTARVSSLPRGRSLLEGLAAAGVDCLEVDERALATITETEQSQGIVAAASLTPADWEALLDVPAPFLLIVDGVQDPGNLGTIVRTAEAAGVTGVLLTPGVVDPYSPKVIRATMGALFRLPVATAPSAEGLASAMREREIALAVADARDGVPYYEAPWMKEGLAIVIGSEAHGPQPIWRERAGLLVRIPLAPPVESLNAAVASAVLLFEAARHRSVASKKGL